jgi:hypothetical protein
MKVEVSCPASRIDAMYRASHALSVAALAALAAGCAGGTVGHHGDGVCLYPGSCREIGCCTAQIACSATVCEGLGYVCGLDSAGSWTWLRDNQTAACDDGDPCTTGDQCVSGRCLGLAMSCTSPPAPSCRDGTTLVAYSSPGTCVAGTCSYQQKTYSCPKGCANGQCTGKPCLGVTCNTPPTTCYKKPGTCNAGKCSYTRLPAGTPCGTG